MPLRRAFWIVVAGVLLIAGARYALRLVVAPAPRPAETRVGSAGREGFQPGSPFEFEPGERPRAPPSAAHACAGCHAEIVENYARSGMSRSWRTYRGADPPVQFPTGRHVPAADGYQYEVGQDAGGYFVEESAELPGGQLHRLRFPIDYLIGSGNHAVAAAMRRQDALRLLPLAYFTAEQRWRLSPGYEQQNVRFSRPVTEQCIACHATFAPLRPPTLNHYSGPVVDGIGCARCHGDPAEHLRRWQAQPTPPGDPGRVGAPGQAGAPDQAGAPGSVDPPARGTETRVEEADGASARAEIVNPARLPAARTNDICLQCHLQGIVSLPRDGQSAFSFTPGEYLSAHRLDFLLQTDNPSAFGVASHGARMLQSRCYTARPGEFTCVRCHDPHRPVSDFDTGYFDARCLDCHGDNACSRSPAAAAPGPTSCVRCHMPQRGTREGQHLVFTDHWIRSQVGEFRPDPQPLREDAEVKLTPVWPAADPQGTHLGAAYVWLHEAIGPQRRALARGVALLEKARREGHRDPLSDYWLASGYIDQGRPASAVGVWASPAGELPGELRALWKLGIAYWHLGQTEQAIQCWESCLRKAPYWTEPCDQLAHVYLQRQEFDQATRVLRQQVTQGESPGSLTNLATAIAATGSPSDAEQLLQRALALDPRYVPAYLHLAWLRIRAEDREGAAELYRRVLQLDPGHAQAQAALQSLQ